MAALYDVTVRAAAGKTHKLACVRAVRQTSHAGNWFPTAADFMTPDRGAIREALPHYWRKAFDRAMMWHVESTLDAYATLYSAGRKPRVLASINCAGYERE